MSESENSSVETSLELDGSVTGAQPSCSSSEYPPVQHHAPGQRSRNDDDTLSEAIQPSHLSVGIATIGIAAISAFYRELALIQIRGGAMLAAWSRRDLGVVETLACEAAATWQVARAALQLVESHAGDSGELELARRALEASCRVLLYLLQHIRTSSAGRKPDAARLHEVLRRLDVALKRAVDPDKTRSVEPKEQSLGADKGGRGHE